MLVNVLWLRTEYFLHFLFFSEIGWHHWKKPLFMVKDSVWHEASKEHTGIPHVPYACHLWEAWLLTKEGVPKISSTLVAIVQQSHVSRTLSCTILEIKEWERQIEGELYFLFVGIPRGAAMRSLWSNAYILWSNEFRGSHSNESLYCDLLGQDTV